ncbi:MAG: metallophosphoesterase [Acidobacteriota bacterium]|nr:metallophosphoesterase [Acidobacteriota bacterium]
MRLLAISDLHVDYAANRAALDALPPCPDDWLVLAGDVGHATDQIERALRTLTTRFAKVIWVPGNHELWTTSDDAPRGEALYGELVARCRACGVVTPEDPYPVWPGDGPPCVIAPLFLLYDYSFAPDGLSPEAAVDWAVESGVLCADERLLHPDPYPTREAWCEARCRLTEARLAAVPAGHEIVLVNHFPLRRDLAVLPAIPRFTVWCGTRRTETWHTRFPVRAAVSGHLHIRATHWRDGVRFEEVSFGYPRHWQAEQGLAPYLREILPGPAGPAPAGAASRFRRRPWLAVD